MCHSSVAAWAQSRTRFANEYAQVRAPALILAGRLDRFYSPALFEETAALIPGSQLRIIERRGHVSAKALCPYVSRCQDLGLKPAPVVVAVDYGNPPSGDHRRYPGKSPIGTGSAPGSVRTVDSHCQSGADLAHSGVP